MIEMSMQIEEMRRTSCRTAITDQRGKNASAFARAGSLAFARASGIEVQIESELRKRF
jgi:hypothetical protein